MRNILSTWEKHTCTQPGVSKSHPTEWSKACTANKQCWMYNYLLMGPHKQRDTQPNAKRKYHMPIVRTYITTSTLAVILQLNPFGKGGCATVKALHKSCYRLFRCTHRKSYFIDFQINYKGLYKGISVIS